MALFCNRSNAHNKLGDYRRGLEDGSAALMCNSRAFKAHYRCGSAFMGLGRYKDAGLSFRRAADLCSDAASRADALCMMREAEERSLGQQQPPKGTRLDATAAEKNSANNALSSSSSASSSTTGVNLEQLLACLNASQWWHSEGNSTIEVFEKRLKATEGVNSVGDLKRPMKDAGLFVVPSNYTGPRVSRPPKLEEVKAMAEYFRTTHKPIHPRYAATIAIDAWKTFRDLPSLVDVPVPAGSHFTVCGDVHGQFYDLLHIFEINGWPSAGNPYLFNGDYVDRGSFSCEVLLTLFALRAALPHSMLLARGNHETATMNYIYGFSGEVASKYHQSFDTLMTEIFNYLPLAHVLAGKVFVVHGGLSINNALEPPSLADIRALERARQPPEDGGLMSDLLWADPHDAPGRTPSHRGVGYSFGPDITKRFLEKNGLTMIVRSHEVKDMGFEVTHNGCLATVFSAPNYCDRMGNLGAFVRFTAPEMKPEFVTFKESKHPPEVPPMHYVSPSIKRLGVLGFF